MVYYISRGITTDIKMSAGSSVERVHGLITRMAQENECALKILRVNLKMENCTQKYSLSNYLLLVMSEIPVQRSQKECVLLTHKERVLNAFHISLVVGREEVAEVRFYIYSMYICIYIYMLLVNQEIKFMC